MTIEQTASADASAHGLDDIGPSTGFIELLTWLGEGKRLIIGFTFLAAVIAAVVAMLLPPTFTARTTVLPPGAQQQGSSAAALAALGGLGSAVGGLGLKSPDELYVALLKSDSVLRALDTRFGLKARYEIETHEALRRAVPNLVRVYVEKKTGVINIEVDDKDPKFAADLANAHVEEVVKVLSRLAVSEAQQRRAFFEQQLQTGKEALVKAETDLQRVQETSGAIALEKQAEVLISGAAQVRGTIAEREVQLQVLRTGATDRNPDVMRLISELRAMRIELARMEAPRNGKTNSGRNSALDLQVDRLPEATVSFVRARREMKLQETLLESIVRQLEIAKLDEAKEGPLLQQVDRALPPDFKSKPGRTAIVGGAALLALFASVLWVLITRYMARTRGESQEIADAWQAMKQTWRLRA